MRMPRARLTVVSLMVVVAAFGLVANWMRPISQGEAVELATRRFRQVPGAPTLDRVKIHSYRAEGDRKYYWLVNFWDPSGGRGITQISLNSHGEIMGVMHIPVSPNAILVEIPTDPLTAGR